MTHGWGTHSRDHGRRVDEIVVISQVVAGSETTFWALPGGYDH